MNKAQLYLIDILYSKKHTTMDYEPTQQVDAPRPKIPIPEVTFKLINRQIGYYQSAGYSVELDFSQDSIGILEITANDSTAITFLGVFDGSGADSQVLTAKLVYLSKQWLHSQRIEIATRAYITQVLTCLVAHLQQSVNDDPSFSEMVSTCNIAAIVKEQNFAIVAHLGDSPTIVINQHGEIIGMTVDDNGESPRAAELLATGHAIYNCPYFEEVEVNDGVLMKTGSKNMSCGLIMGPNANKPGWLKTPVITTFELLPGYYIMSLSDGSFEYWLMALTRKAAAATSDAPPGAAADVYRIKHKFLGDKERGLSRIASDIKHCAGMTSPAEILHYMHESHLDHATQIHADYLAELSEEEIRFLATIGIDTPEKFRRQFDCQADNRTIVLYLFN
jgi:serine/threonine protein phosphatase PrpC